MHERCATRQFRNKEFSVTQEKAVPATPQIKGGRDFKGRNWGEPGRRFDTHINPPRREEEQRERLERVKTKAGKKSFLQKEKTKYKKG